ncbi:MAG: thioredoxin domain-containing protein [Solirubrobacterales bacterium]
MSRGKRKRQLPQGRSDAEESAVAPTPTPNSTQMPQTGDDAQRSERRAALLKPGIAAAFLMLIAVVALIAITQDGGNGGDVRLEGVNAVKRELRGIPQGNLIIGDPTAEVALLEFGDLQCFGCRKVAEEALPAVISSKVRSGESRIEFVNYPVIGDESVKAARAAIAAGNQGRGWNFVELFYRNQGKENSGYVTDAFLTAIAEGAGVADIDKWNRDREGDASLAEIKLAKKEGKQLGVSVTPSFSLAYGKTGYSFIGTPLEATQLEEAIEHGIQLAKAGG